ncbi:hypothetical protein ElyMa_006904400 [Elysia marginata]|uniref:Uncharacterized protein n=1 Tax=Elysia marginata TaxID=1093978 RepID=A0AAV4JCW7_9GAST|nr:hypothetical protein ElyMa_006904400 [Elysia marginata]
MGFDSNSDTVTERSSTIQVHGFKNFIHHLIGLSMDTQEKMKEMQNFTDIEFARPNSLFQILSTSSDMIQSLFNSRLNSIENHISRREIPMDTEISQLHPEITHIMFSVACKDNDVSEIRNNSPTKNDSIRTFVSNPVFTENRLANLESVVKNLIHWPTGHYALLQPTSGCPLDQAFEGGNQKYLKLHT